MEIEKRCVCERERVGRESELHLSGFRVEKLSCDGVCMFRNSEVLTAECIQIFYRFKADYPCKP